MISVGVKIRYIILMILVFFALIAIIVFLYQILYKNKLIIPYMGRSLLVLWNQLTFFYQLYSSLS